MSVNQVGKKSLFFETNYVRNPMDDKVQAKSRFQSAASRMLLEGEGKAKMHAAFACPVRGISYDESDCVRIYAAEGFTLKAQIQEDMHRVYVEQKNEDGTYQAYEVNPMTVDDNTENPIEQIAAEAWNMARRLGSSGGFAGMTEEMSGEADEDALSDWDFEKMLEEFRVFVEKRIKDGPPKIPTGGTEFSEEEWEQMLRKIDHEIDAYKEELRQRIQKQKEEAAVKEADSAAEQKSLAGTAGAADEKAGAQDAKTPEQSERKAVAEQSSPERGHSFLARLSGEKKAPYSFLADASGVIIYKGVTFVCDDKKQQICLGDMSDTKNVLTIPLSKGGCLKVNRNSLGDLAKAIEMFSPEDIGRIMRAIAQDSKARELQFQVDMQDLEFNRS